jgi:4-aminobutyrate aminotransferase-like enzyme
LLHAMGDVHPHRLKAELARELSGLTFERWSSGATTGKTIFCNSGFEAVETALKTAALATSKPGVIAFSGAYHGLGYGALNVTERAHFRTPFISQLRQFGQFVRFPESQQTLSDIERQIRDLSAQDAIGAILVEPIQGRAGVRIPPREFLPMLRRLCDELNLLLICDEIFTGFGRTGKWFASEHTGTVPDLICLGKALTGGFPLSACVGAAELMDRAWPPATGEAIHTSTFLGHPVGCAMALAQISEIKKRNLVARSAAMGKVLESLLRQIDLPTGLKKEVRVLGLMAGVELKKLDGSPATDEVLALIKAMLDKRYILLPEGEHSNVISFTPPLIISQSELKAAVKTLTACSRVPGARTSGRLKPRISKGLEFSVASQKKVRLSGLKSALR